MYITYPKIGRWCPFCQSEIVFAISSEHLRIGKCRECGHYRQIPPPGELYDLLKPSTLKLFVGIVDTCLFPKVKNKLVFNGNIRSQGKFY